MITLQRTTDMQAVRQIATDSRIWDQMSDDNSPEREDYEPAADGAVYVLVIKGDVPSGMFVLVPRSAVRFEIHTLLLPDLTPWQKLEAAARMRDWVFAETKCERLFTEVPLANQAAYGFARAAGMELSGLEPKSFLKGGVLHDVAIMGMNRPEGVAICR